MDRIEEFIQFCLENKERLNTRIKYHYTDDGVNLINFLEIAKVIYEQENKEQLIEELEKLKNILMNICVDDHFLYSDSHYSLEKKEEYYSNFLKNIEYLKNYDGFWNKEYFMKLYRLTEKNIDDYKEKMRKRYAPSFAEKAEKQTNKILIEKEKIKKFREDYEFKENILSEIDLKKYEALEKDSEEININNVHYPIIVKFFKNNKVISINKCTTNLYNMLATKKNLEFDRFNVVHVSENIIDDMVIEYKIKYDPIYNSTAIIQNMKKVYKYRHENQVRNYYKDRYNMTAIKKIVRLYEVSTFTFYSGAKIYNRVELEEAIEKHLKSN